MKNAKNKISIRLFIHVFSEMQIRSGKRPIRGRLYDDDDDASLPPAPNAISG